MDRRVILAMVLSVAALSLAAAGLWIYWDDVVYEQRYVNTNDLDVASRWGRMSRSGDRRLQFTELWVRPRRWSWLPSAPSAHPMTIRRTLEQTSGKRRETIELQLDLPVETSVSEETWEIIAERESPDPYREAEISEAILRAIRDE